MQLDKAKNSLNVISNVATLIAMVAVAILLFRNYRLAQSVQSSAPGSANLEDRPVNLAGIDGVAFSKSNRTLVMFLSTQCIHCTNSAPFYGELSRLKSKNPNSSAIVAAFPQPLAEDTSYLQEHSLHIPVVGSVDYARVGVRGTPTLVLVDSAGNALHTWIGELSDAMKKDVLIETGLLSVPVPSTRTDASVANGKRSYSLLRDERPLLVITPSAKASNPVSNYVTMFDVDENSNVYVMQDQGIAKYSRDGTRVGLLSLSSDRAGVFCVDAEGNLNIFSHDSLYRYSANLAELTLPTHSIPILNGSEVLKVQCDRVNSYIYVQAYNANPLSQTLYKIDPKTMATTVFYRQARPVQFSPNYSPGAFDFAIGDKCAYVSDIYGYQVRIYSLADGSLNRVFSAPYKRRPIGNVDGVERNWKMTVGSLTGPGKLAFLPPIIHLSWTDGRKVLIWTSARSGDFRQVVDIYDENMKFLGSDLRYMNPGLGANYAFIHGNIYAPIFELVNDGNESTISPLDLPGKPYSLGVFKE